MTLENECEGDINCLQSEEGSKAEDLLSPEYGCGSCSYSLLLSQFFHGFQCKQSQEEVQVVLPQSLYMLWNIKTRMPNSSIVSRFDSFLKICLNSKN
ncbi:unnamed protein product, partial [Vitis vinifera]|uniref:Uncharacterized protein n=1 Tax=Vitis vinifera TaxID=29760 RepID=D7SWS7_VITVI